MNRILVLLLLTIVWTSCTRNSLDVNISKIDIDLSIEHYEDDLFGATDNLELAVPDLAKKYGDFFSIFNYQMIRIGAPENDDFFPQLSSFLSDTVILDAKKQVDEKINKKQLEVDFVQAFKHYKYYFPEKIIPNIVTCVSGFNQSVVVSENLIGISLDKYLGADCVYYSQLGFPNYKTRNMHPAKIVADAMYAWALTDYPIKNESLKLVEQMVFQGKMLYFLDAMMPDLSDSLKIGYTQDQLQFCEASEQGMWTYLAEQKLLFSTDHMEIKRYVDDGPYTAGFTSESPGRAGVWIGWQIVKSYMKKNPKINLKQLMENDDSLGILNQSAYQPG